MCSPASVKRPDLSGRCCQRLSGLGFTAEAALPLTLADVTARLVERTVLALGGIAFNRVHHQHESSHTRFIAGRPIGQRIDLRILQGLERESGIKRRFYPHLELVQGHTGERFLERQITPGIDHSRDLCRCLFWSFNIITSFLASVGREAHSCL